MNKDLQDLDDIADQHNNKPNVGTVIKPSSLKNKLAFSNPPTNHIYYRRNRKPVPVTLPKFKFLERDDEP